jgi:hypothetical protein
MYRRAVNVEVVRPYVIDVTFDDGSRRRMDLESELWGEVFEPLRDPNLFAQARVEPDWGTVVWPTGADLGPEFLSESSTPVERERSRRR